MLCRSDDLHPIDVPPWLVEPIAWAVVSVLPAADFNGRIEPQALNHTDTMQLSVFSHGRQAVLVARLDNLGKGASGAAVQNMELMLA